MDSRTVAHETLHAIGFDHEQNRPDRDEYIEIVWQNVEPKQKHNFDVYKGSRTFRPFDFQSQMLYEANSFGVNGRVTMRSKVPGQRFLADNAKPDPISKGDILAIQALYKKECAKNGK